jgi:hypothetical protein
LIIGIVNNFSLEMLHIEFLKNIRAMVSALDIRNLHTKLSLLVRTERVTIGKTTEVGRLIQAMRRRQLFKNISL